MRPNRVSGSFWSASNGPGGAGRIRDTEYTVNCVDIAPTAAPGRRCRPRHSPRRKPHRRRAGRPPRPHPTGDRRRRHRRSTGCRYPGPVSAPTGSPTAPNPCQAVATKRWGTFLLNVAEASASSSPRHGDDDPDLRHPRPRRYRVPHRHRRRRHPAGPDPTPLHAWPELHFARYGWGSGSNRPVPRSRQWTSPAVRRPPTGLIAPSSPTIPTDPTTDGPPVDVPSPGLSWRRLLTTAGAALLGTARGPSGPGRILASDLPRSLPHPPTTAGTGPTNARGPSPPNPTRREMVGTTVSP